MLPTPKCFEDQPLAQHIRYKQGETWERTGNLTARLLGQEFGLRGSERKPRNLLPTPTVFQAETLASYRRGHETWENAASLTARLLGEELGLKGKEPRLLPTPACFDDQPLAQYLRGHETWESCAKLTGRLLGQELGLKGREAKPRLLPTPGCVYANTTRTHNIRAGETWETSSSLTQRLKAHQLGLRGREKAPADRYVVAPFFLEFLMGYPEDWTLPEESHSKSPSPE